MNKEDSQKFKKLPIDNSSKSYSNKTLEKLLWTSVKSQSSNN
jgi:hypothetical protein